MTRWLNRILIAVLFAALVVALLWFQGLIFRPQHVLAAVPELPALAAGERTVRVEARRVPRTQLQPGFVEPLDAAHVSARVMANVLEVTVREGDPVESGASLVRLDDRDAVARVAQARAAREVAQSQATAAQLGFERVERLRRGAAATEQDWENARAAHEGAVAALARASEGLAEAEAALSWFEVRAPFAGRVLARQVEPGQLAAPGQPLVTLYRDEPLRVTAAIPEQHAARLPVGADCELEFDGGERRVGRVSRVLPAVDATTGSITLHIALDEVRGRRPGQLVRVEVPLGERVALLAPAAAVERIGQIERVRVVLRGRVTPVTIRTGKRHGDVVEVLSGLREGEEVVTP